MRKRRLLHTTNQPQIDGHGFGAEVAGPQRTVRWWFREGERGAQVEVLPR
ncbi:MAG: hypothetical protein JSR84_09450 [Proteobacteria bacterium]|nr:hypothetical protein [Pseudomonadota bacterium]